MKIPYIGFGFVCQCSKIIFSGPNLYIFFFFDRTFNRKPLFEFDKKKDTDNFFDVFDIRMFTNCHQNIKKDGE